MPNYELLRSYPDSNRFDIISSQPQIADTRLTLSLFSFSDVTRMSSTLSYESRKYQKNAKALSRQALIKKYMPFAIIGGVIFVVLFFRWLFY